MDIGMETLGNIAATFIAQREINSILRERIEVLERNQDVMLKILEAV